MMRAASDEAGAGGAANSAAAVSSVAKSQEDSGLPHLAVLECRARCLLIDLTKTDDEDSLKSILNAAVLYSSQL
jgi:hypothetical protein